MHASLRLTVGGCFVGLVFHTPSIMQHCAWSSAGVQLRIRDAWPPCQHGDRTRCDCGALFGVHVETGKQPATHGGPSVCGCVGVRVGVVLDTCIIALSPLNIIVNMVTRDCIKS